MKDNRTSKKKMRKQLFNKMKETLESKRSIYLHQINNLIPSCFSNNLTLLEFVNRYYFCDWHTHLIGGIVIITVTRPSHIFSRNTKIK